MQRLQRGDFEFCDVLGAGLSMGRSVDVLILYFKHVLTPQRIAGIIVKRIILIFESPSAGIDNICTASCSHEG